MLSDVLHSPRAILVNLEIMRTFVKLRKLLDTNRELSLKIGLLEQKYDRKFKIVFDAIRALMAKATQPTIKKVKGLGSQDD